MDDQVVKDAAAAADRIRDKRIGLVLAGGGGKGAYQVGCLQVLEELQVTEFCCVTGTSVGALNAALVGAGRLSKLSEIWENIGIFKVMRPTLFGLLSLPAVAITWWFSTHPGYGPAAVLSSKMLKALQIATVLSVLAVLMFVIHVPWLLAIILLKPTVFAVLALSRIIHFLSIHRFPSATNAPLRRLITDALFEDGELRWRCPTIAVSSTRKLWFDPDFPSFDRYPMPGTLDPHFHVEYPLLKGGEIPQYHDLTNVDSDTTCNALLASSALPFIFPSGAFDSGRHSDGGVIENIPINPALTYAPEFLIVIYLDADKQMVRRAVRQIPRLRRVMRLCDAPLEEAHQKYLNWLDDRLRNDAMYEGLAPEAVPLERIFHSWDLPSSGPACEAEPLEKVHLPTLLHVVPSQSLGGMLSGTLCFSKRKARQLIALGRSDMIRYLAGLERATKAKQLKHVRQRTRLWNMHRHSIQLERQRLSAVPLRRKSRRRLVEGPYRAGAV
jgi:predicted acylesterase/phospholipase RssA